MFEYEPNSVYVPLYRLSRLTSFYACQLTFTLLRVFLSLTMSTQWHFDQEFLYNLPSRYGLNVTLDAVCLYPE